MLGCSLICGFLLGILYDVIQCLCRSRDVGVAPWAKKWMQRITLPGGGRCRLPACPKASKLNVICKALLRAILDAFFCLIFAVVLIVLLYYTNDGQFRSSAVAMSLAGFGLYCCTLRRLLSPLLLLIRAMLRAALYWTVTIVTYPVRRVLRWLGARIAPLARHVMLACRKRWQAFTGWLSTARSRLFKPKNEEQVQVPSPPTLAERIRQTGEIRHGFVSGRKYK